MGFRKNKARCKSNTAPKKFNVMAHDREVNRSQEKHFTELKKIMADRSHPAFYDIIMAMSRAEFEDFLKVFDKEQTDDDKSIEDKVESEMRGSQPISIILDEWTNPEEETNVEGMETD